MTDSPSKGELMRHRVKPRSLHIRVNMWDGPCAVALSLEMLGEDDYEEVCGNLKMVARSALYGDSPKQHAVILASMIENFWPLRGYSISVNWEGDIVELEREPAERV